MTVPEFTNADPSLNEVISNGYIDWVFNIVGSGRDPAPEVTTSMHGIYRRFVDKYAAMDPEILQGSQSIITVDGLKRIGQLASFCDQFPPQDALVLGMPPDPIQADSVVTQQTINFSPAAQQAIDYLQSLGEPDVLE